MSEYTKQVKARYSCKRKRDFVTFLALLFFALLVVFQLYLTLIAPIQLKSKKMLIEQIAKDELFSQVDGVRWAVRRLKCSDDVQVGQRDLTLSILDNYVMYLRAHKDHLVYEDILTLREEFQRYGSLAGRWSRNRQSFVLPQEFFPEKVILKGMEQSILQ